MSKVLEQYLEPGEEILWWGQPHPDFKSTATWVIQVWGAICFLSTGVITMLVMSHADELGDSWGFAVFFIVLGVLLTTLFLFGFPILKERSNAATIYAVTNTSALVLAGFGAGRLQRMYVEPEQDIRLIRNGRKLYNVRYYYQRHRRGRGRHQTTYQFNGLEIKDAEQARAALLRSQGRMK